MAVIICPECGMAIEEKTSVCKNCGYPLEEMEVNQGVSVRKLRNVKMVVGIILAFVVLAVIIVIIVGRGTTKGYYKGIKWGTSYSKLVEKYDLSESFLNDGLMEQYVNLNGVEGLDCVANFSFDKQNGLSEVVVLVQNNSSVSDSEVESKIRQFLSKEYGEAEKDEYGHFWETKVSKISLHQYSGYSGSMVVIYEPLEE